MLQMRRALLYGTLVYGASSLSGYAQSVSPCPTQILTGNIPSTSSALICLIPQVYGPGGLVGTDNGGPLTATTTHEVHFQASAIRSFTPVNEAIGTQLNELPLTAPVAGLVFSGGAVVSATQNLGPILTDRADTLGRSRMFLGLSYQRFEFDKLDGISLGSIPAVFKHEVVACTFPGTASDMGTADDCLSNNQFRYTNSIIATRNQLNLTFNQVTFVATYGVAENFDVSVAVPVPSVRMGLTSAATIYNVPTLPGDPVCGLEHTFVNTTDPTACLTQTFSNSETATGLGDITLRGKMRVFHGEKTSFSVAVDVRLPTGDAMNFLGAGTWGIRPFGTYSANLGVLSPHATIAIQGNGQSVLAGDVTGFSAPNGINASISKSHLPDILSYAAGVDATIHHRFGASVDYLGQTLFNATRVRTMPFPGYKDLNPVFRNPGVSTYYSIPSQPDLTTYSANITLANISAGIKVNLFRNLIVTGNGLFRLNVAGLHAKPSPLVGVSYSF